MTRKKIKHEQLPNGNKKNTIFRNRRDGLLKKANQMSILCGVETAIVIHTQEENNAVQWPSPEIFNHRVHKFFNFPEMGRYRKMVIHDKYLEQVINDERKNILKTLKRNEFKEFDELMSEIVKGKNVDEFDLYQLNVLKSHSTEFINKLEKRDLEIEPVNDGIITESELEKMKRDACFLETMSESQHAGFINGGDHVSE